MYFLVQMKFKTDGTVDKGTSAYETKDGAVEQFHIAIASAMQKPDTDKFTAVILDENGEVEKREVLTASKIVESEDFAEPDVEQMQNGLKKTTYLKPVSKCTDRF